MKKTLFIAVLATCLLFAFSGVAMAKYAGYAYNQVPGAHPGYLSWDGATAAADFYSGSTADTSTPHGNYTANTVKCAVCHSVHRAYSGSAAGVERTTAGVGTHLKLTAGLVCTACHTASGASPVDKLIEWPSAYDDGGPHARQACVGACHAGVHGANLSNYEAASAFMLNPVLDTGLAAGVAANNVRAGIVDANTLAANFATLSDMSKAGNRAMVTGYLCAQAGCHTSSQFAVNQWSYGDARASDPGDSANLDLVVTGHRTTFTTNHCSTGGCHQVPGNVADSICAACHDMVGVATNTTAWPHANRAIGVYEWTRDGAGVLSQSTKTVDGGNLWMYGGDVTYRDAAGEPTATLMWDGKTGVGITHGAAVGGFAPNRINTRKVIEDAAAFDLANNVVGNINDGTCLKCHGYEYWPAHGMQLGAGNAGRNFSRY